MFEIEIKKKMGATLKYLAKIRNTSRSKMAGKNLKRSKTILISIRIPEITVIPIVFFKINNSSKYIKICQKQLRNLTLSYCNKKPSIL